MKAMRVRLLLFAAYRDMAGASELELELPASASAREAVQLFRQRASRIPAEPVIAINREYSDLDVVLNDGDELALLPPVAGG